MYLNTSGKSDKVQEKLVRMAEGLKGIDATKNCVYTVVAVADILKTSLGPNGMRKLIIDRYDNYVISNDAVTILRDLDIQHPVGEMLVNMSKTHVRTQGDGGKITVLLAAELARRGLKLFSEGLHPSLIISGYYAACETAMKHINELSIPVNGDRALLKSVAKTSLSGKFSKKVSDHLSNIAVEAVSTIAEGEEFIDVKKKVQFVKREGGGIIDTELVHGVIISKDILSPKMPRRVENAKIALLDEKLYIEKPVERSVELQINSPEDLEGYLEEQRRFGERKFSYIKKSGANVVVTEKGIDKVIEQSLSKNKILGIRRAKPEEFKLLSKACGARICSKVEDLKEGDLGYARLVEERKIGRDKYVLFSGCRDPKAVAVLVRGGSWYVCEEVERLLRNAMMAVAVALMHQKVVGGGGSIELELAKHVRKNAYSVMGKKQLAMIEFASALEQVPRILASNAGMDETTTLLELRSMHSDSQNWIGVDVENKKLRDMVEYGVIEPSYAKIKSIKSATEFASSILRVDGMYISKMGLEKRDQAK
ncbi:MAG: thermosome subunit beta [Candidatus Freyrarchaeum guaymaensis]